MTRKRFEKLLMSIGVSTNVARQLTAGMVYRWRMIEKCDSYDESYNQMIETLIRNDALTCKRKQDVV